MTEHRPHGGERASPHDGAPALALAVERACLPVTAPAPAAHASPGGRGPAAFS